MSNVSGIHPIFDRVLIKPLEVEKKTASGIVLSTDENNEREQLANTTGEIIEMGSDCPQGVVAVGNRVIFAKYAGLMYLGKDERSYRMVNYDDLVGVLDDDMNLVDVHLRKGLK